MIESAKQFAERRRLKLIRFAICEVAAIALTILSILAGIYTRSFDNSDPAIFRFLPVTFAIIATALPILFFGKQGRRSRGV